MANTQPGASNKGAPRTVLGNPNATTGLRQDVPMAGLGAAYARVISGTTGALTAADNGGGVQCTNGSAVTLTVPSGLGAFTCYVIQMGAGQVTPTASGTTISNRQSFTKTAGQYAMISLVSTGADAFVMGGDGA